MYVCGALGVVAGSPVRVATEAPLVQTVDQTHTQLCIYISESVCVCVGGAEQQLNISLRTLLSDCCREGGNGGVKEVVCLYLTSVSAPRVELLA